MYCSQIHRYVNSTDIHTYTPLNTPAFPGYVYLMLSPGKQTSKSLHAFRHPVPTAAWTCLLMAHHLLVKNQENLLAFYDSGKAGYGFF